jgi:hypothetical protein
MSITVVIHRVIGSDITHSIGVRNLKQNQFFPELRTAVPGETGSLVVPQVGGDFLAQVRQG